MMRQVSFGLCVAVGLMGIDAAADTIQLRDKGSITGTVLSEKKDTVAIDIGYTVLVIPKAEILDIGRAAGTNAVIVPELSAIPGATNSAQVYTRHRTPVPATSVKELVQELGEAVVQVRTPSSIGSGFILNEEGFLITNFHVIEGETQITIEVYHQEKGLLDRKTYKQVRIMAMNKFQDLALLRIEDKGAPKFKYVALGNSDSLTVGDRVFAVGSPLGLERTVTEGIVSTKTRQMSGELYLQTTAQINPGNSGGPLFSLTGEVVGVTNMKITFGEGLGFAIPVDAVRYFLDHRDAYAFSNENPANAYRYLEPPSRTRHKPEAALPATP